MELLELAAIRYMDGGQKTEILFGVAQVIGHWSLKTGWN